MRKANSLAARLAATLALTTASSVVATAAVTIRDGPGWVAIDNTLLEARVDLTAGSFTLTTAWHTLGPIHAEARIGATTLRTTGAPLSYTVVDFSDPLGDGKRLVISRPAPPHTLELALELRDGHRALTASVAVVAGTTDLVTGFALVAPEAALAELGDDARALAEADQSWTVPPLGPRTTAPAAEGLAAIYSPAAGATYTFGALTQREYASVRVAAGLRLEAAGPRAEIPVGSRATSDLFAIGADDGQNTALERYADDAATLAGATAPAQPEWGWMTWYAVSNPDEAILAVAANALAGVDKGRGEAVLILDDTWQTNNGDWLPNARFPSGMPAVAAIAHDLGLRAGLWLAPFGASEVSQVALDHPDWLVEVAPGTPHVVEDRAPWGGRVYRLDPSVPGVNAWLGELMRRVTVDWGFDLVKLDFLYWGLVEEHVLRAGADPRAAFRAALDAMRAAAGPGTTFLLSGMPIAHAEGRSELVRSSPDAFVELGRHKNAYRSAARRAFRNGAAYHADADVLLVRPILTDGAARQRATFMTMVGGPVFFGDGFWASPAERQALQARLVPPHPYRGRPLDVLSSDLPRRWRLTPSGGSELLAAITYDEPTEEIRLDPAAGLAPRLVYDTWGDRALGSFRSPVPLAVAGTDAALLATRSIGSAPAVVATDGHIVGAVDIIRAEWAPYTFDLEVRGAPETTLRVFIGHPDDLVASAANGADLELRSDGLVALAVALDSAGAGAFEVLFAPTTPPPPPPSGRPAVTPPPGVRVVPEEAITSSDALTALLDDVATGTFVVVLPPPDSAPAPARLDPAPWVESTVRGVTVAVDPTSLAATLADELGLPHDDASGVLLNVRAGIEPAPVDAGMVLRRAVHTAVLRGDGALLRLGRLPDELVEGVVLRLGDSDRRARVRGLLRRARQLERDLRDGLSLDGTWRFRADPGDVGVADGWAAPGYDDSGWESIPVPATWESAGHPGLDGVAWYRRAVQVPRGWAGIDLIVELLGIDDADTTWLDGVELGSTQGWTVPRRYPLPAAAAGGKAQLAVRVQDYGAGGGIHLPVRLRPDADAARTHLGGSDLDQPALFAFLDADDLRPAPGDAVLYAVREGDGVRLVVRDGAPPFDVGRGSFPRADPAQTLDGGPFGVRSAFDAASGDAAYTITGP